MLSFIHSRRVAHDLMVLAVLAMEAFFAWRASLMYVFILTGRVNAYELEVVRWLVFLAVGVFGFALATHRHAGVEAIRKRRLTGNGWAFAGLVFAVAIVVLHDVAATIYTVGLIDSFGAAVAVVGMCGLVFLPFLVGYMSHSIAAGIEEENAQHAQRKVLRWQQQAELRYWKKHYRRAEFVPQMSGLAMLPSVDAMIASAVADEQAEDVLEEDDTRSDSGAHRSYISADEVAEVLGVSVAVAKAMMRAHSRHPFAIVGCKNIRLRKPVRGQDYERRAPYAAVLDMKAKMEADRRAKVRPLLRPQDEQERA